MQRKRFGVDCAVVNMLIPENKYKKLQNIRKEQGVTVTAIINKLIDDYLKSLEEQPKDSL